MTAQAPTYDLVLMLDQEAEEPARGRPLADARAAIEAQGELLRHDEWGSRAMTYPINRRAAADYHLLQFHTPNPELLRTLDRSLRIADEVLRFRIVKLRPGTPDPPDMRATAAPVLPAARRGAPAPQSGAEQASPAATVDSAPAAGESPAPSADEAPAAPPEAPAPTETPTPAAGETDAPSAGAAPAPASGEA